MFRQKIKLAFKLKKSVLALGAQTKNRICFAQGCHAYLGRLRADLGDPDDFGAFVREAQYYLKKKPKIIACDLHPEYQSTKYAADLSRHPYPLSRIQHHHAHIVSCMAENGLKNQKVIGVAFDGTGLGSDHTLWGSEFTVCDYKNFQRKAHLKEVPLLGGERAILEPWRTSAFWLYLIYKDKFLDLKIRWIKNITRSQWPVLKSMYLKQLNSPPASSMGRLFDAAASLILSKHKANFEAQLAMELEKTASGYAIRNTDDGIVRSEAKPPRRGRATKYGFKIIKNKGGYIIDPLPMFRQIVADLKTKETKAKMAYSFHLTVAEMVRRVCLLLGKENRVNKVVLSGGVFQNNLLLGLVLGLLYKEGFQIFRQRDLSCNDSGIALGQAAVAAFSRQKD